MKLYWTPASPFVRKVMVVAAELGLTSEIELVPTYWPHSWGSRTIDFDPSFIAANPVGRIPALVTREGIALPESNAICHYLDSLQGSPRLIPASGRPRWEVVRTLGIADGALEAMIARRAETLRVPEEQSESFISKQRDRVFRCLDTFEATQPTSDGVVDIGRIAMAVVCGYLDFRYPEDVWRPGRPWLSTWYEDFARRPSMRTTAPAETPQSASAAAD